ncbi:MmgE/PrpD family protein [Ancylobacter novellus DSM 506]|uniref:MmgE/PrpD family protein n=1 Tax=Ancylobacter novellus (strain ATCC 8093 / DSM 506 / JCM 20403 / CCM 1077 / IAM 12100 / NBRC 12443 / NCIMB 10456) TaxID=639283 RepID=D7A2J1_ANCN5|nr:MmgE/PrpD family protein [Ancylobacter novellus]ADH91521.1 MmgE/PrpD family protein [Ancylobacter novellus DSM 506]
MSLAPQPPTLLLSEWATGVTAAGIPDRIRQIVTSCVIDTIGVALAGARTPVAGTARHFAARNHPPGRAEIWGTTDKMSALAAAFCNGTAAHALDFDDNCYAGFVHGSAVIVPAAVAVAQDFGATGAQLITAITAGAECEYAVGAAAGQGLYDKGWWTTGLLGPIGAGVAAGHLLRLDPRQMRSCIGLAVTSAGGAKTCFGNDAKALLAGQASESGVKWATLAANGASGADEPFVSPNGFAALHIDGPFDISAFTDLGRSWRLETPGIDIKKFPICLSSHAAVDVVVEIMVREGFSPDDVEEVLCDVPPVVVANLKYGSPATTREAQFSMEFAIAATLCFGAPGLEQLNMGVLESPAMQVMMPRVRMAVGPMWDAERRAAAPEGASVVISLKDGRRYSGYQSHALGTAFNPVPPAHLREKFLRCAEPAIGEPAAQRLLQALEGLDADVPVRDLLNAAL